jgi:hypothetical protein
LKEGVGDAAGVAVGATVGGVVGTEVGAVVGSAGGAVGGTAAGAVVGTEVGAAGEEAAAGWQAEMISAASISALTRRRVFPNKGLVDLLFILLLHSLKVGCYILIYASRTNMDLFGENYVCLLVWGDKVVGGLARLAL